MYHFNGRIRHRKTSVGMALAVALNAKFLDGDDLHPRENILKMAAGQALNDEDRLPRLTRISDVILARARKTKRVFWSVPH